MSQRIKKGTGMYAYLANKGVLDRSEQEIKDAKREYYRQYKREWKRRKLKANKSYLVVLSAVEYLAIRTSASRHKRSITRFLKEAALAYSSSAFVVPDVLVVYEIKDLFNRTYIAIQKALDSNRVTISDGKDALALVDTLEQEVLSRLQHPALIETWFASELKKDTKLKDRLLALIQE